MAIAEITVVPLGNESMSDHVAEVVRIIDASELKYTVTPMGTVIQGPAGELFAIMRKCHESIAAKASRVFTTITIDDRKGADNPIETKVQSVVQKLGKPLP